MNLLDMLVVVLKYTKSRPQILVLVSEGSTSYAILLAAAALDVGCWMILDWRLIRVSLYRLVRTYQTAISLVESSLYFGSLVPHSSKHRK